nr:VacJ family lipoprotein [Oceanococcus sp. HetDA_MAG_MS8]
MTKIFGLLVVALLSACAHQTQFEPRDPLEPVNRAIFKFNDTADRYVLRPLAVGYDTVTPEIVQMGVSNFFANLFYPVTVVNQYAQGKWLDGTSDLGRFVVNSTVGLAGFVDVAKHWGLPAHREDFGQTLGSWGVGEGWFLVIPFLGPSTNRDLVGMLVDAPFSPVYYVDERDPILALTALNIVQIRAGLLGADGILNEQDDRYAFLRSAYLQQRQSAVRDGAPAPMDDFDDLLDEDFEDSL